MESYSNRVDPGGGSLFDAWTPFRGKYPDPTPQEFRLIFFYLHKYACEADDFVESKSFISLKNRLKSPNLRQLWINFLRQVRGSKGYDVDMYFDFMDTLYTVFIPRNLDEKEFYDEAMAASNFAVGVINSRMMAVGKSYVLMSVEKSVLATIKECFRSPILTNILLLTFTTHESSDAHATGTAVAVAVALQAMVRVCDDGFRFIEWKYKPMF